MLTTHKIPRTFTRGILLAVLLCMVVWEIAGSGMMQVANAQNGHDQSGSDSPLSTTAHTAGRANANRPVLAFYYMWYTPQTWCLCHMSDLPTIRYNSNDTATIDRQIAWAAKGGNGK